MQLLTAENEGIKRSNSSASVLSKSSEEVFSEGTLEEQKRRFKEFADKHISKTENQIHGIDKPVKDNHLSFHEEHFEKSPLKVNAERPHQHSIGHSTFYEQNDIPSQPCYEVMTPQGNKEH